MSLESKRVCRDLILEFIGNKVYGVFRGKPCTKEVMMECEYYCNVALSMLWFREGVGGFGGFGGFVFQQANLSRDETIKVETMPDYPGVMNLSFIKTNLSSNKQLEFNF